MECVWVTGEWTVLKEGLSCLWRRLSAHRLNYRWSEYLKAFLMLPLFALTKVTKSLFNEVELEQAPTCFNSLSTDLSEVSTNIQEMKASIMFPSGAKFSGLTCLSHKQTLTLSYVSWMDYITMTLLTTNPHVINRQFLVNQRVLAC